MAIYSYTAIPQKGRQRRGTIEATTAQEAKEQLRQQGVLVTGLWERNRRAKNQALKGQARVSFTSQLAQLIGSDLPIFTSLVALEEQCAHERYHATLRTICDQIKGGSALSAALARHPESFDALYCTMVAAGEESGTLPAVLKRLATLLETQRRLKKQLISALTYPAVIAIFCVFVVYLLLTFAVPSMAALLGERNLNGFTSSVLAISAFLSNQWPFYLPTLAGLALGLTAWMRSKKGGYFVKQAVLRLPVIGNWVVQAALARFCRTLATLQEGGVTLINSLRLARGVMLNPVLEETMRRVEAKVIEGGSLSGELSKLDEMPRLLVRMIAVGENSGNLSPMLLKVADLYEENLQRSFARLTSLIQPIVLLVMGGIIGLIMLAVLLPLTDVSSIF